MVGTAAVVGIGIGFAGYLASYDKINKLTQGRLKTAAQIGVDELKSYLTTIEHELVLVAEHPGTVAAVKDFAEVWQSIEQTGDNPESFLQKAYVTDNPNPVGKKHLLDRSSQGSAYDDVHARYHPWFRQFQQDEGFYDVFLFDTDGNLIYSVFKEADYATNFKSGGGKWAATDLGAVYRRAMKITKHDEVAYEDFEPYGPRNNAPAFFMAHPVVDIHHKTVGVMALQLPVSRTSKMLEHDLGLGESGELVLVGEDRLMRQ